MSTDVNGPAAALEQYQNEPTWCYSHERDMDKCTECRTLVLVQEIRDSQRRTEKMVTDFLASMESNPMFKTMGRMFGARS